MEMSQALPAVLPIATSIVGGVLGAEGGFQQAQGNYQAADAAYLAGVRKRAAFDYEAAQLRQNAGQAIAASQHERLEKIRLATLAQSRLLAVAGASGGGVSDPTVVKLSAMIAGEGALRGAMSLYQGAETARQMRAQATASEYSGYIAEQGGADAAAAYRTRGDAADFSAKAGIITTGLSMLSKYGDGGFNSTKSLSTGAGFNGGDAPLIGDFGNLPGLEMTMMG